MANSKKKKADTQARIDAAASQPVAETVTTSLKEETTPIGQTVAIEAPVAIEYKFDSDGKAINRNLVLIAKNGASFRKLVHETAVACVMQAIEHRNADYAIRLFETLGGDVRKASLVKWFEAFAPVTFTQSRDKNTNVVTRKFNMADKDSERYLKAKAKYDANPAAYCASLKTFWEYDPEKEFKPLSFRQALAALIKRGDEAAKKVYPKGHALEGQPLPPALAEKVDVDGLAQAKAVYASLEARGGASLH